MGKLSQGSGLPSNVQENTTSWSTEQLIFSPPGATGMTVQFKRGLGGATHCPLIFKNPSTQVHVNPPMRFRHCVVFEHSCVLVMAASRHSLMSSQALPSTPSLNPFRHPHTNDPLVLVQLCSQAVNRRHSFRSVQVLLSLASM